MRVAHIGNLCNAAYQNCKGLRRIGVDAHLFITTTQTASDGQPALLPTEDPRSEGDFQDEPFPEWISLWPMRPSFGPFLSVRRKLKTFDLVHAYTLAPIFCQFAGKPFLCEATGSDIRETARGTSLRGILLRRSYRKTARFLYTDPDEHTQRSIADLRLRDPLFIPTIVDLDTFRPRNESEMRKSLLRKDEEKLIFAPARQDWSTKGNDILLRGFAQFLVKYPRTRLVARSWGPDHDRYRELARQLKVSENVTLMGEMSKKEIARHMCASDAVAGFFVGPESGITHFPLIIQESLACGTPTVTYCDDTVLRVAFSGQPPFVRIREADSIASGLEAACYDLSLAQRLRAEGLAWAQASVSSDSVANLLLETYEVAWKRSV